MMSVLAGLLTFFVILCIGMVLYAPAYQEYLMQYGCRTRTRKKLATTIDQSVKRSIVCDLCKFVGQAALRLVPNIASAKTQQLLVYANYRSSDHTMVFFGMKLILVAAIGLPLFAGAVETPLKLLSVFPTMVVTWLVPDFFLARRAQARKQLMMLELPTVLDLMIVCAQAGLGLLSAIDKVTAEISETCPHLAEELAALLNDVRFFAKPVQSALQDMSGRCGVEAIDAVVATLISSEARGADLSYPLRQQAEAIRDRIKRKREEEASKTPVKMVPVIMLFIMPLILTPMLGPAVLCVITGFGSALGNH